MQPFVGSFLPVGVRGLVFNFFKRGEDVGNLELVAPYRDWRMMLGGAAG